MNNLQYSKPTSKRSVSLKILIGVLGLFLISGMAYGSWKIFSKSKPVSVTRESSVQPAPTPTADWKVYRNEKYGYEIKYPADWIYKEFGEMDRRIIDYVGFRPKNSKSEFGDLGIDVLKESLAGQRERLPHSVGFAKEEFVKISGISSVKISGLAGYPIQKRVVHILVPKSPTLTYEISYSEEVKAEIIQNIKGMISTFKLISK